MKFTNPSLFVFYIFIDFMVTLNSQNNWILFSFSFALFCTFFLFENVTDYTKGTVEKKNTFNVFKDSYYLLRVLFNNFKLSACSPQILCSEDCCRFDIYTFICLNFLWSCSCHVLKKTIYTQVIMNYIRSNRPS